MSATTASATATATATAAAARVIAWFEIPSIDFNRATNFYEAALDIKLQREVMSGVPMAMFAHEDGATGGCITYNPQEIKPVRDGVLVYLNAEPSVKAVLDRVERAGGKKEGMSIELPNNFGYIGFFIDTEGNRIGLHSPKLA